MLHASHATICCVDSQDSLLRDIVYRNGYMRFMGGDIHKERGIRLAEARRKAGYENASDFARSISMLEATYRTYEGGTRTISYDKAHKFAEKLGVSGEWILSGNSNKNNIRSVPIVGRSKSGVITASHPLTGGLTMNSDLLKRLPTTEVPPEMDASMLFAIEVEDNHYAPFICSGAIVYYNRLPDNPDDCIGALCIIQVKGGDPVFDILMRGKSSGFYDTQYHGRDIEIDWCSKRRFTKDA